MTVLWTAEDATAATAGTTQGDWSVSGLSIDTRTIKPGEMFVALSDARDGHDFVAEAFAKGAGAALVSRVPDGVADDAPLLLVDDVLNALNDLARAGRARTGAKVIGITGSAGKTSTKDMLRHVLSFQGKTHAAEASYNNHWGVPLTLARMPADTDYAVIEIGMNHPGEIAPLSVLARPHIAIVTTVAAAHLEAFASIEEIAIEKASIFEGLEPGGLAIFNADIETTPILNAAAKRAGAERLSFGQAGDAVLCARNITLSADASVVEGRMGATPFLMKVGAPGRHFAMNALAVVAAAHRAGADLDIAASDLASWHAPAGRGARETLVLDPVEGLSIELMDDAFNANPASMAAALEVLVNVPTKDNIGRIERGRRIAILGDMLELGPEETALHTGLADLPTMQSVDIVHCVGQRMRALYDCLPAEQRGRYAETAEELAAKAHLLVDAGDVVLVKGSKGSHVSRLVDAFRKLAKTGNKNERKGAS